MARRSKIFGLTESMKTVSFQGVVGSIRNVVPGFCAYGYWKRVIFESLKFRPFSILLVYKLVYDVLFTFLSTHIASPFEMVDKNFVETGLVK